MPVLVLATKNRAKAERLRHVCEGLGFHLMSGDSFPTAPEVDEDADSHLGNAIRKAVAWSAALGELVVASDGGLAIPALGAGWSSLVTRRGTGGDVSDEEHARRLLRRMRDLSGVQREAHWTEAVAVARDGAFIQGWEASGLHGRIAEDFRPPHGGANGFWVSGLWQALDGRRYWELTREEMAAARDPWEELTPQIRDLLERLAGG